MGGSWARSTCISTWPPTEGRKYGFFASLADMDDQEFTTGTAGVEVMADIAPGTVIEARAGIGMMRGGALGTVDYVTLSGGLSHAISDRTSVFVQATVSEFQEQTISATGYEALAGIRHSVANGRVEVMAALGTTGLWGEDSAPAEPAAYLGVTWRLSGAKGQKRPVSQRAFETWQPARPLMVLGRF